MIGASGIVRSSEYVERLGALPCQRFFPFQTDDALPSCGNFLFAQLPYNLIPALKPGARVGIVNAFRPTSEHGTPPSLLRCELAAVGYREISLHRLTGSDTYLAIFARPLFASRTRPEAMVACKAP
jgi:hypothetical protein